ncbi:MAG: DUF362 domain-containing protein [Terriglobales bacterium]
MDRRQFLQKTVQFGGVALASPLLHGSTADAAVSSTVPVALVKTSDRRFGVNRAIDLLELESWRGKDLFVKPNFNSADPPPGSTHIATLSTLMHKLKAMKAGPLTIGERSGMGNTRQVMDDKGAFTLAREVGAQAVVLDELGREDWELIRKKNSLWQRGFAFPRMVRKAGGVVQTCCLKTHRFGGHFTLSLKNSVGLAAKYVPGDAYNYMNELHTSPNQRRMIAEINAAYRPDLVLLDGVDAFTSGGPESGNRVAANVVLAGTDRIAMDAVGVAILRYLGTTPEVSRGAIFEQEQIARAVELNLGVRKPTEIHLLTGDRASAEFAECVRPILDA